MNHIFSFRPDGMTTLDQTNVAKLEAVYEKQYDAMVSLFRELIGPMEKIGVPHMELHEIGGRWVDYSDEKVRNELRRELLDKLGGKT